MRDPAPPSAMPPLSGPLRVFILGGAGNAGRAIARILLAEEPRVRLVLAGRDLERARRVAEDLDPERCTAARVDAGDGPGLEAALSDQHLAVIASSTVPQVQTVIDACIGAGVDYVDLQLGAEKVATLKRARPRIEAAGIRAITEGGFHPGVPAALVREVASFMGPPSVALVGSIIRMDWRNLVVAPESALELTRELGNYDSRHLHDGQWRSMGWSGSGLQHIDFGPFGVQRCAPLYLEELAELPARWPTLEQCGFFVGGFDPVTDNVVLPLVMLGMKVAPATLEGPLSRLLLWSLRRGTAPPFVTVLHLHFEGEKGSTWLRLWHEDGYVLTAAPVVACLLQWRDDALPGPGLYTMANAVEPRRFVADLARLGIHVDRPHSPGMAQWPASQAGASASMQS